jgi:hypothetical protein
MKIRVKVGQHEADGTPANRVYGRQRRELVRDSRIDLTL